MSDALPPEDGPSPRANRQRFERVAPRYDLLNCVLSLGLDRRWRRRAAEELRFPHPTPSEARGRGIKRPVVLDVGCGTADLAVAAVRRWSCRVVGVDVARGMLSLGALKVGRAGLCGRIRLALGDAMKLPFADASFDGVTCGFCLRNLADRQAAVAEMRRVLRPGGRVVILELGRPRGILMNACHRLWGRLAVRPLGRLFSRGNDYDYLVRSVAAFPRPDDVLHLLRAANLTSVRHTPLTRGIATLFVGEKGH